MLCFEIIVVVKDTFELGFLCVSEKKKKGGGKCESSGPLALSFFKLDTIDGLFRGLGPEDSGFYSLVKMSEEVGEVEVAQRRVGFGGSFRVRREERVRD